MKEVTLMLNEKEVLNEVVHHLVKANIDESVIEYDQSAYFIAEKISGFQTKNEVMIGFTSIDLNLNDLENKIFMFYCISNIISSDKTIDFLLSFITENKTHLQGKKIVYFICIHSEVVFDSFISSNRDTIEAHIKKNAKVGKEKRTPRIVFDFSYIPSKSAMKMRKSIKVKNRNGMFSNNLKDSKGHIFTANLFDLVEVYHLLGNRIFTDNIRFGISDKYNVDKEIIRTLTNSPEEFWHLNNGITIVCRKDTFDFSLMKNIILNAEKYDTLSVINGAQTIRASSRMFADERIDSEVKKTAIREAWVLLRIIQLGDDLNNQVVASEKIAIALNRQKPIQPEDIAFKEPQISTINSFADKVMEKSEIELTKYVFKIVRRGDQQSSFKRYYSLEEYARVAHILFQNKPGEARNASREKLLGMLDSKENIANLQKILPHNTEGISDKEFEKYYKPVIFLLKSKKCIDEVIKGSRPINPILNYSRYLILYCIFNSLLLEFFGFTTSDYFNEKNKHDYSSWNMDAGKAEQIVTKESIMKLLDIIKEKWDQTSSGNPQVFDSNAFKSDLNIISFFDSNKEAIREIFSDYSLIDKSGSHILE